MFVFFAALLALGHAAPSGLSSFSCAISTVTLKAGGAAFKVCDYQVQNGNAAITLQWYTGTFGPSGEGCESVLISFYLDGESTPSLQYYPYQMAGFPSFESFNATPSRNTWSAALFGRYSASSWNSNIAIPFLKSLSITLQYMPAVGGATVYYQAHGVDGGAMPSFAGATLPPTARLLIQVNRLSLPALAYLPVVNVPSGSGLILGLAIAFVAPNLNTLEGCFHFYPTLTTPYPGQLHSTGTEDEFMSSYYFDLGVFQGRSAGIFYKTDVVGKGSASMYRTYESDPMIFSNGGRFVWRNGDTADATTGIKCMIEQGGVVAGNPGTADVQTLSYVYVW